MHIFLCDTNAFKHSQQYWSPLSAADCVFMIIKTCHCGFSCSMYLKDIACFVINLLTLYCRQFISFIFWQIYTRCYCEKQAHWVDQCPWPFYIRPFLSFHKASNLISEKKIIYYIYTHVYICSCHCPDKAMFSWRSKS